jgi:alanine racemase
MRTEARVDLSAVRHNVGVLAERAAGAAVMAVVKADGYGHGLVPTARAAVEGGASWLGVAFLEEALALRAARLEVPILAWLTAPGEDLASAVAAASGRPARVQLKADTGLSRGGAQPADWPALCDAAAKAEADGTVKVTGLWSHFAFADGGPDHPTNSRQTGVFREALDVAATAGLQPEVRHLANSAATLTAPATHFDLVRPGLAVYGLSPVPQLGGPRELGLRPAMTLASTVALTKRVPAGSGVSYLHRYVTAAETSLALVPLGYADGIGRNATNVAQVQLGDRRRTIAGTVCMDQFVLDVGDDPVEAGDEVLLFGPGDAGEPTAQDWADWLGTINYEIVTRVGARVPRTYTEESA